MDHPYTRLEHEKAYFADWFVVNWCLGNTCNFECSYCPKALHDGSIRWPELDTIKSFITKVKEHHSNKNIYFEFTGGEVTMYKHFIEVCKFCTELGIKVGLISNGSRTIRYWEQNKQYFDHVCLSFHPEFADAEHFTNVVRLLHNDIRVHVNVMMSPEKFDYCFELANSLKDLGNISIAMQPLIHDFGEVLFDYTPEQQLVFENQWRLITKHIKFTKPFPYYRGAMRMIKTDGTTTVQAAHKFIANKSNDWSGWKCYAGVEQLIVDMNGIIHRGWCKVGKHIGHINDTVLNLPTDPIICNKNSRRRFLELPYSAEIP